MSNFIEIDGSEGEGGGQILRSSLALSILTGRPFRLINIRANRPKPGLAPQHLACVRAAAAICSANYKDARIGSSTLFFEPGPVKTGDYFFDIPTAGSAALVLHTVYLPLALRASAACHVAITGGTHVAFAPTYPFLETTWAGHLRQMGLEIPLALVRPGFYPRGGGEIHATIRPTPDIHAINLVERPELTTAVGFVVVSGLPEKIAKAMSRRLTTRLKSVGIESHIVQETMSEHQWATGPCAFCGVSFRQVTPAPTFVSLGERGKPSEAVADDAAEEAIAYATSGGVVDPHAADQLVLPLAYAARPSSYRVSEVTQHLLTNIDTIRRFLDRPIRCEGAKGDVGTVVIG